VITTCTVSSMLNSNDGVFNKLSTVQAEPASPEEGNPGAPAQTAVEPNTVLPKLIEVSINFAPIHEQTLGHSVDNKSFALFPYGVKLALPPEDGINVPPSVTERVKKQRTAEDARRRAASAQQERDKALAKAQRAYGKLNSGKELNDRDRRNLDAYIAADRELESAKGQSYETAQSAVEDIGEFLP